MNDLRDLNEEDRLSRNHREPPSFLMSTLALSGLAILVFGGRVGITIASALVASRPAMESAVWVYRNDPLRHRGTICCLFHVTAGIWHGAPSALLTLVLVVMVEDKLGRVVNAVELTPTLIGLFTAIGVSALMGLVAAAAAFMTRSKVWVNPQFHTALIREFQTGNNLFSNHGRFVLATSFTMPVLALLAVLLKNEIELPDGFEVAFAVLLVAVPITLIVVPLLWISPRIFTNSPREYLASAASAA